MLNNSSNENDGDLNQRNPAIVEEYQPRAQERIKDKIFQVAVGVVAVGATSALSFGICAGATRGDSKCLVLTGLIAGMASCGSALFMYCFNSFRSQLSLINQVPRLESEIVVGMPFSSVSSFVPEIISVSQTSSPRLSLYLERVEALSRDRSSSLSQISVSDISL